VLSALKGIFFRREHLSAIKRVIYVFPEKYNELTLTGKYDIARIIGKLNKEIKSQMRSDPFTGAGRWERQRLSRVPSLFPR